MMTQTEELPRPGRFVGMVRWMAESPIRKWAVPAVLLSAGLGVGLFSFTGRNADAPYQTAAISRGELTQEVTATGTLNPVNQVEVGSQITGRIKELRADFNSSVKAGEIVALIDPAQFQAAVHQAEGDVATARAALRLAQQNAERARELYAKELVPAADLDKALADLDAAKATVKVKEAALEKAQVDLDHCTINSPVDGLVISRNVEVGQTVSASLSAPTLFVIAADLTKMRIKASVTEADIGLVKTDQQARFTVDAYPGETFRGKVSQVRNSPITVLNVVTYETIVDVNNSDLKLKPGMTANVSFIVAQRDDALRLPNSALRVKLSGTKEKTAASKSDSKKDKQKTERTVYIVPSKGGQPQAQKIKTGITDGKYTEVVEGLKEGDEVVTGLVLAEAKANRMVNPFSSSRK
jgi:HlyD family secretion protein